MTASPPPAREPPASVERLPSLRRRFWIGFLAFTLPSLAAIAAGWALDWLDWRAALVVAAAACLGPGWLLLNHTRHMRQLIRYVEEFRRSVDHNLPEPPGPRGSLLSAELDDKLVETTRERQRRRRELEALISGNEAILATLPYPLLTLTEGRRVARANPAAVELFDGDPAGQDLISVLREPAIVAAVDAVLEGTGDRVVEFSIAGSMERFFVAHLARLPAAQLDDTVAILALMDITALKRAEQLRADFVANASHELKTPLASLLGFIETLRGPARDDAEARLRFLSIMQEQAERMARLVEDLLSLSRIELHEHTPPNTAADLVLVLEGVVDALEMKAARRGMALRLELPGGLPDGLPPVQGDRDELAQVFQNLVDNAIKYGRTGTPVVIEVAILGADDERLRRLGRPAVAVTVVDQGEGIAREHLPRLTERFYRVDTARSREMGGTGLGLAIVKHIVNRHRGHLEVESELGRGSRFTVTLRAAVGRRPAEPRESRRPQLKVVGR
jgi:two-component system, OmpR family, phosphate regulon sensor histidine kinase PhoR